MSQSKIKAKSGKQMKKTTVQSKNSVTMVHKPYYAGIDILKIIAALLYTAFCITASIMSL